MYDIKWPEVAPVKYSVKRITNIKELEEVVKEAEKHEIFSFDYETAPNSESKTQHAQELKRYSKLMKDISDDLFVHTQMVKGKADLNKVQTIAQKRLDEARKAFEEVKKEYRQTVFDPHRADIVCISMSCTPDKAYIAFFETEEQREEILSYINEYIFKNESIYKVAYNLEFEAMFSLKYGMYILGNVYDPLIAVTRLTQVLQPENIIDAKRPATGLGLKPTAAMYLKHQMIEFDKLLEKYNAEFFDDLDYNNPDVQRYVSEDAICSLMLALFWAEVGSMVPIEPFKDGLKRPYETYHEWLTQIEMPFTRVIGQMRYHGMWWNKDRGEEVYEDALKRREETSKHIVATANKICVKLVEAGKYTQETILPFYDMDIGKTGKTKVMHEFLFNVLELPVAKTSDRTGNASLDAEALMDTLFMVENNLLSLSEEKLLGVKLPEVIENVRKLTPAQIKAYDVLNREPMFQKKLVLDLLNSILDMQKFSTLISSHIEGRKKYINPKTQRIHSSYTIWTETSRTNSQRPNCQNVPRPDNDVFGIRTLYQPAPGKVFILADQSGFELRLMAWRAKETNMIQLLNDGADLHMATAVEMTGKPASEVSKHERSIAKAGNFGINYGGTEHALQKTLKTMGIRASLAECTNIINAIKRTYPNIPKYQQEVAMNAAKYGFVDTIFGYKRLLPHINSYQIGLRASDERRAANTPIQGSAADIMKLSQNRIYDYIGKNNLHNDLNMVAQIHDEIIFEVTDCGQLISNFVKIIREIMETPPIEHFPVRLTADVSISTKSWGEKVSLEHYLKSKEE